MDEDNTFNILLLGETGVGKSTLINSVANYLHFSSFDEADRNDLRFVIPSSVTSIDQNGDYRTTTVGSDKNEFQEIGVSATQNVKSYIIPFGKTKLRLIDSPGMGDTRGIFKDEENCENLANFLAHIGRIHAICFLLRPSITRITAQFEYSIKQILSRLDVSAAKNILFVFTNTRGVDYGPGETLACLKKVLEKLPNTVPLKFFCLDNEAFRYLVTKKQGCDIDKRAKKKCKESWQHSSKVLLEFMLHVKDLEPYNVNDKINEAKRVVVDLVKVLSTISKTISDNAQILKRQQQNVLINQQTIEDLKTKLNTTVVSARVVPLPYPVTLCVQKNKCAQLFNQTWHYPVCHMNCRCTGSVEGIVGLPTLKKCTSMDTTTLNCRFCGCRYNTHMTVQYLTEKYFETILNPDVRYQIDGIQATIVALNTSIKTLKEDQDLNQKEHDIVKKSALQFVQYLKAHVICPFNDTYEKYIKHLVIREKSLGNDCDPRVLGQLEELSKKFEEEKRLNEACCEGGAGVLIDLSPESIKSLCNLKQNGLQIKRVYENYVQSVKKNQMAVQEGNKKFSGLGKNPANDKAKSRHRTPKKEVEKRDGSSDGQSDLKKPAHDSKAKSSKAKSRHQPSNKEKVEQPESSGSDNTSPKKPSRDSKAKSRHQPSKKEKVLQQPESSSSEDTGSSDDDESFTSAEEDLDAPWEEEFKGLRINESKFINILLLGETGVGKSTFINSLANYFHFNNFRKAMNKDLLVVIPSLINVQDKYGEHLEMHIGSDKNEYQEVGASGTQNVKTYVFPIGDGGTKVRLIDSPGMGDTRGVVKDDENCENILAYLAQLEELHAICFLMRPTNTRITVLFEYCVKQILSRLEKSASENIIFIFTNTRGTDYEPGETFPCLKKVIEKIKSKPPYVKIPLNRNVFCLDNEAFRVLAAMQYDVKFSEKILTKALESWERSSRECWRMISYIVGDDLNEPITPHQMSNSISINEARRMIVHLSKPLADISQLISDNLRILQRHHDDLATENQSLDEMKAKLYVPVINLKLKELPQPVTVCTELKCAELYQVREIKKWHYKERCHNPCYLNNVSKEIVGDPGLRHCAAMDPHSGKCRFCGCDYTIHMHIYYETETYDDSVVDDNIKSNIQTKEKVLDEVKRVVEDIKKKKIELEREHEVIVRSTAQFAHFLQNNAISPFNDSYKEYIKYLIVREKSLGKAADMSLIKSFENMLQRYEEEKAAFDKSLSMGQQVGGPVSIQTIFSSINSMFALKHNGKKIKEIYDKQKSCMNVQYQKNCEYIHPKATAAPRKKNTNKLLKKFKKFVWGAQDSD